MKPQKEPFVLFLIFDLALICKRLLCSSYKHKERNMFTAIRLHDWDTETLTPSNSIPSSATIGYQIESTRGWTSHGKEQSIHSPKKLTYSPLSSQMLWEVAQVANSQLFNASSTYFRGKNRRKKDKRVCVALTWTLNKTPTFQHTKLSKKWRPQYFGYVTEICFSSFNECCIKDN